MKINDVLDNVFPMRAIKREMYKQAQDILFRNYDAGQLDRINNGWKSTYNQSGVTTDEFSRDIVRARARDLERNSSVLNSMVLAYERNVVKDGINLQAKTENQELNDELERLWHEWCKARNCDVVGEMSFPEMLRNSLRRKIVDGGIFLVKTYTGQFTPFQIQLLEVDELDIGQMSPKNAGNTVVAGVEVDKFRKPVGYWFLKYSPEGTTQLKSEFFSVEQVIFYKHKQRPTQIREISQIANMMMQIRSIESYVEAVSLKERISACLAIFITRQSPVGTGLGRMAKTDKSSGYKGLSLTPGMIQELEPGDSVTSVMPPAQGASASDYVRLEQRMSGAGIGLSYESASRDMSQVNYSSARQGLIEDEGTFAIEQELLVNHVLKEIYTEFVISAVLSGLVVINDFWGNKNNYLNHTWIMPGRKWIDPLKEANANKVALITGQQTLAQVVGAQGRDWKEHIDEIAEIQKYAHEKGVSLKDEKRSN